MRFFSRAALVASLAASSLALPALRTYRGKSPYISVHEDPALDAPLSFPNPRDDPAFYQARYAAAEALERGKWHERPAWADRVVDNISAASARLDGYAAAVGVDLPYLRRTLLPAASGRPAWNPHTRRSFAVPTQGEELVLRNNASASSFRQADSGFDYRRDKVRGVNLGNWLVLEAWMDAALFGELNSQVVNAPYGAIIDEWTMGLYGNYRAVEKIIKRHLDEWMTEDEFRQIAAAGLNHVRIPIGYWAFAEAIGPRGQYYTFNQFAKLKEACGWAKKHGLKVWVDLHGVPGSQNGYDNSGKAGPINWAKRREYYEQTQYAYNRLVQEFTKPQYHGTVTAIEAVNEPAANRDADVKELLNEFYPYARDQIVKTGAPTLMAFHDGFITPGAWENFFSKKKRERTLLDTHPYFVYTDEQKRMKDSERLAEVCSLLPVFAASQLQYATIAGEMAFNGPSGDRPEDRDLPVGPVKFPRGRDYPFSVKYMAFMARNSAVQRHVFETAGSGWLDDTLLTGISSSAWAWKNRDIRDWSYKAGLENGWNPYDLDAKPYG
ncbi:glycoside hydrolase, partial [Tilletiopsis washingtonensis]